MDWRTFASCCDFWSQFCVIKKQSFENSLEFSRSIFINITMTFWQFVWILSSISSKTKVKNSIKKIFFWTHRRHKVSQIGSICFYAMDATEQRRKGKRRKTTNKKRFLAAQNALGKFARHLHFKVERNCDIFAGDLNEHFLMKRDSFFYILVVKKLGSSSVTQEKGRKRRKLDMFWNHVKLLLLYSTTF